MKTLGVYLRPEDPSVSADIIYLVTNRRGNIVSMSPSLERARKLVKKYRKVLCIFQSG